MFDRSLESQPSIERTAVGFIEYREGERGTRECERHASDCETDGDGWMGRETRNTVLCRGSSNAREYAREGGESMVYADAMDRVARGAQGKASCKDKRSFWQRRYAGWEERHGQPLKSRSPARAAESHAPEA
ncbi:hypothetical protein FGB62_139g011 [Gracilaria domingensis]|nr:hypothetical protein FGB62_139g011 [Gracilaria domingensis]